MAVIEADYIASGNTGRNTTIIRANYGLPEAIRFYQHSLEMYRDLEDEVGAAILHQTKGIFWLAHTEMALRTERARAAMNTAAGAKTVMVTPAEIKELVPQIDLTGGRRYPVLGASHHLEAATARHDRVAWAYAAGRAKRGVHVIQHTPVTGLVRDGDRVVGVETRRGPRSRRASSCRRSAAGSPPLAAQAGLRLPIRTHPLHAFVTNDYEQGFGPIVASTELNCYVSQTERGQMLIGAEFDAQPSYSRQSSFAALRELRPQDHADPAVPARSADPSDVGGDLRHLGRFLADHGRHRRRRLPRHDRLGDVGLQGDPGGRRGDGRARRHRPHARPDRALRARPVQA